MIEDQQSLAPFEERSISPIGGMPTQPQPKWQLKKLTKRHKDIAALLLSGVTHDEIANVCDCHKQTIVVLKQQPIFQEYLNQLQHELEDEFRGLFGKTVRAIRESLSDDTPKDLRLRAARLVLESQGRMKGSNTAPESAEDVAKRLIQQFNFQVIVQGGSG